MGAKSFEELEVWQTAHRFVLDVYQMTKVFPSDERFGLTSQLRRTAVSVPANIAEGFIKRSKPDKLRFYNIAQGSLEECRYYLILAKDMNFADTSTLMQVLQSASRLLQAYCARIIESS